MDELNEEGGKSGEAEETEEAVEPQAEEAEKRAEIVDNIVNPNNDEESEDSDGIGSKYNKKSIEYSVNINDQFRFPLKYSTSQDVKRPLHLRRVQLFWPHCEEWFSGTLRLQPNKK